MCLKILFSESKYHSRAGLKKCTVYFAAMFWQWAARWNEPDMRECKRILYDSTTLKDAIQHVLVIFFQKRSLSFSLSAPSNFDKENFSRKFGISNSSKIEMTSKSGIRVLIGVYIFLSGDEYYQNFHSCICLHALTKIMFIYMKSFSNTIWRFNIHV